MPTQLWVSPPCSPGLPQIRAAKEVIGDSDFFLVARTDVRATSAKNGLNEAITRANVYIVSRAIQHLPWFGMVTLGSVVAVCRLSGACRDCWAGSRNQHGASSANRGDLVCHEWHQGSSHHEWPLHCLFLWHLPSAALLSNRST